MKKSLILSFIICFSLIGSAQNFLYEPSRDIDSTLVFDEQLSSFYFNIHLIEEDLSQDVSYSYNILERSFPTETEFPYYTWYNQLCDPIACYSDNEAPPWTVEYTVTAEQLQNERWAFYTLTLHPGEQSGVGKYVFEIWKNNDPTVKDTITWLFHFDEDATSSISNTQDELSNLVNIFPNPSVDHFFVENTANTNWQAKLMNVNGKVLENFQVPALGTVPLNKTAYTAKGNYYLILENDEGNRIIKEVLRN